MDLIKLTCCEAMIATCSNGFECVPSIASNDNVNYYIKACDADLEEIPIRFCPWCGVSIAAQVSKQKIMADVNPVKTEDI